MKAGCSPALSYQCAPSPGSPAVAGRLSDPVCSPQSLFPLARKILCIVTQDAAIVYLHAYLQNIIHENGNIPASSSSEICSGYRDGMERVTGRGRAWCTGAMSSTAFLLFQGCLTPSGIIVSVSDFAFSHCSCVIVAPFSFASLKSAPLKSAPLKLA